MSTTTLRPLVAGNWKMNGTRAKASELMALRDGISGDSNAVAVDVMVCPPATLVMPLSELLKGTPVAIGAQDCHPDPSGAHTGDVSAEILADAGATAVIVGHSERRTNHKEEDALVHAKAKAAHRAGLTAIICIGETAGERDAGDTLSVVRRQLEHSVPSEATAANTVIAYEPVWAIGTGVTPTADDVAAVHAAIRSALTARNSDEGKATRILYGGSVKPDNASELMAVANVDGALVGGASLKAPDFLGIIAAYRN